MLCLSLLINFTKQSKNYFSQKTAMYMVSKEERERDILSPYVLSETISSFNSNNRANFCLNFNLTDIQGINQVWCRLCRMQLWAVNFNCMHFETWKGNKFFQRVNKMGIKIMAQSSVGLRHLEPVKDMFHRLKWAFKCPS